MHSNAYGKGQHTGVALRQGAKHVGKAAQSVVHGVQHAGDKTGDALVAATDIVSSFAKGLFAGLKKPALALPKPKVSLEDAQSRNDEPHSGYIAQ